jgi:hypothetical protein
MRGATLAICLFIAASSPAPRAQAPAAPTFRGQTSLVLVAFHVTRGKGSLQPSDVVLLEDGKPRQFTIFDSAATQARMPLELVLLFDINPRAGAAADFTLWDPAQVYRFSKTWENRAVETILGDEAANLRVSVYGCAGKDLYKVYSAGTDAARIAQAIRYVATPAILPLRDAEVLPLTLPATRTQIESGPFTNDFQTSYFSSSEERGWPMEAAIATLNDVATAQDKVARIFVMFSQGISATTTLPEDVGNRALDLGIPIYPVALNYLWRIDDKWPRNLFRMRQFKALGRMTGGRSSEYGSLDANTLKKILEQVKADGLSQYVIGFTPSSADAPKQHSLEVKLGPNVSGSIEGGKRRATY